MVKKLNNSQLQAGVKYVIGAAGAPAYQNGWQAYGTPWGTGGNYFIKSVDGLVTVSMMTRSGTLNAAIFTLPVGFRPGTQLSCAGTNAGGTAGILIDIGTDGIVKTDNGTSNAWLAFNFTFLAEQ